MLKAKLKILHIAQALGGVETYIRLVAHFIDEKEFELILVKDKEGKIDPIRYKSGEPVKTYEIDFSREINPLKDSLSLLNSLKIVKKEAPSLIHCHSAKAGIIGRTIASFLQIPCFYTPHAFSYLSAESKIKQLFFLQIEKMFSRFNCYLLACSPSEKDRAIKDVGYLDKKVHVVNNSLPLPNSVGKQNSNYNNSKLLCTIGRPSYQKNTLFLLETFLQLTMADPSFHFLIMGVGHYSPDLQAAKKFVSRHRLEENVTFLEWVSREKALNLLQECSVYLSASRYEGLPYAVLEAMSLGKPCVLSNVDGNKDCIINGENGYLFDLDTDPNQIAETILQISNDPTKIKHLGERSFALFKERFLINKNIDALEALYRNTSCKV